MTIYTPSQSDKDKSKLIPEVVTEPLTGLKDTEEVPSRRVVRVTFFRRNGRAFYVQLLFALALLIILACGALGIVVFYRHSHKKTFSGKCGTVYFDTAYHDSLKGPLAQPRIGDQPSDFVEEDIVVMEDEMFEELHTLAFDEVRESYVRHDFVLNFTAIVDHRYRQCFIMKLNRTAIAPPRNIIDLLQLTMMSDSYLRRANVIRQDFEVAYEMPDLSGLGRRIARDCAVYPTHWLEKKVSGVFKRSAEMAPPVYAMMSNMEVQTIYKIIIPNFKMTVKDDKLDEVESAA